MSRLYRTELEEARLRISGGFLRLWEQTELIEKLVKEGKSTEIARELLASMQKTLNEMRAHVEFLTRAGGEKE